MVSNGHTKFLSEKSGNMKSLDNTEAHFPSYEKFNWLIHLQHVRGEINACKDLIEEEIKRSKGKNEFAFYKQGEIFREEGKLQDALESFQACLKLNREHSGYLKEVGKCLYEMRRFKLSLDAYLEAEKVSRSPDWQIYYYLGQCLTKLGDTSKAKEYAHKAVKIGKHEDCYALLVKILIAEGDLKSAIAVSNAAVESCPDSVSMQTESGLLFLKLGQSQHAFERLSAALALEPTYPKALLGIGCITQKHEEYDVALTKYKLAIHYEPDSVALWNNIGTCFYSKQKYVAQETSTPNNVGSDSSDHETPVPKNDQSTTPRQSTDDIATAPTPRIQAPPPSKRKKSKIQQVSAVLKDLKQIASDVTIEPIDNEFVIFGKSVAAQLQKLTTVNALVAQEEIQSILTRAIIR